MLLHPPAPSPFLPLPLPLLAPTSTSTSIDPIQATISHCLSNYAYADAIFLAERLFYSDPDTPTSPSSLDKLLLLATCYYHDNQLLQCFHLLSSHQKSVSSLNYKCRFLLATVAVELGKLPSAESTLLTNCTTPPLDWLEKTYHDSAPFALKLYARIAMATERPGVAKEACARALKLNPFLFNAFELLVKLGNCVGNRNNKENNYVVNGNVVEWVGGVFQTSHLHDNALALNCQGIFNTEEIQNKIPFENNNKAGILINRNNKNNNKCHRNLFTSTPNNNSVFFGTHLNSPPSTTTPPPPNLLPTPPIATPSSAANDSSSLLSPIITMESLSVEPKPKKPCLRTVSSPQQQSTTTTNLQLSWQQTQQQQQQQQQQQTVGTAVRRSSRLFGGGQGQGQGHGHGQLVDMETSGMGGNNSINKKQQSLKENTKELVSSTTIQKLGNKFRKNKITMEIMDRSGLDALLLSIQPLAMATVHLTRYDCKKAIDTIATLKPSQSSTPFALATLARAQFEAGEYEAAVSTFTTLRHTHPYSSPLTYLSSSLWHLSSETALSSLSQEFLAEPANKASPTTWITLGNTFSLQKEHETSIKFFKRAIQIDPQNYYAHVLLGHEYVSTDELDKALRCFRTASRIDGSQYNCWYGIGMIYYKQERFEEARVYYERAGGVNRGNVVLLCHLGVVQSALNLSEKSLSTFSRALALNPNDPLCKFHRASVLFAAGRLDEALEELEELKRIVPKESLVHFLIAKIHSKQGSTHKALLHFSWATDLDPKGANNHIKESIEPVLNGSSREED